MIRRAATYFTPDLFLTDDMLHVSGRMWMENPEKYFEKIRKETKASSADQFSALIDVEHINSSSVKQLLLYFKLLKELEDNLHFEHVNVIWYVNSGDEDILEIISDLKVLSDLDIKISFKKLILREKVKYE